MNAAARFDLMFVNTVAFAQSEGKLDGEAVAHIRSLAAELHATEAALDDFSRQINQLCKENRSFVRARKRLNAAMPNRRLNSTLVQKDVEKNIQPASYNDPEPLMADAGTDAKWVCEMVRKYLATSNESERQEILGQFQTASRSTAT